MPDRVRIHDVAIAAGVSVTTVSHALNGRGKVSESTRQRVSRVARELGYAPNRVASALRLRRTQILGLVSDEIATTPFSGRIVFGAQEAAAERGMTLMLVNSNGDAEVERRQIAALLAQQVDGLLYATMAHRIVDAPAVPESVPLVLVNAVALSGPVSAVVPDEYAIGRTATRLLIDAEHRSIVHLTVSEPGLGVDGRVAGYLDAMASAGLRPHIVRAPSVDATATEGRVAFRQALVEQPDLTAVFCFNDPMAMGVYQVAAERRIEIPRRLSVVGVDDLEIIAGQLRPGLTTVALPHAEMGRWAVQEAIRRLEGEEAAAEVVRIVCPLVGRDSVSVPQLPGVLRAGSL